jgi:hypothetical protein
MGGMMGGNEPRQFGYADGDRRVSALIDMINGGGAGRAGQRFEGGGLLSDIGNQLFRPYGFEERMGQVRPQARPMRPPMAPAAAPAPAPAPAMPAPPMGGGRTAVGPQRLPMPQSEAELFQMFMNASPEEQARIYRDLLAPPMGAAPAPAPAMSPFERFGGQAPAAYEPPLPNMGGGRTAVGPQRLPMPLTFEQFVAGLGPVAQTASPEALMTAYRQHMMGY